MFDLILQTPADSVAAIIGGTIGSFVSGYAAIGLGIATKFVTDLILKVKNLHDKLPDVLKPFIAFGVAFGLTWANSKLVPLGAPVISDGTAVPALLAWAASMGFHSLVKLIQTKLAK